MFQCLIRCYPCIPNYTVFLDILISVFIRYIVYIYIYIYIVKNNIFGNPKITYNLKLRECYCICNVESIANAETQEFFSLFMLYIYIYIYII